MRYLVTGGAGLIGSNRWDESFAAVKRRRASPTLPARKIICRNPQQDHHHQGKHHGIEVRAESHARGGIRAAPCRGARPCRVRSRIPIETNKINIDGTLNCFGRRKRVKVKRVVFAASSSATGRRLLWRSEPCSRSHLATASQVPGRAVWPDVRAVLRPENVASVILIFLGPRQDPGSPYSGVLAKFARHFWKITARGFRGRPSRRANSTYVDQSVQAICWPARRPMLPERFSSRRGGRVPSIRSSES